MGGIAIIIKWQLRSDIIFISFLDKNTKLIAFRQNGNIILQDDKKHIIQKKKISFFQKIIGSLPSKNIFIFATKCKLIGIVEIIDKDINIKTIQEKCNVEPFKVIFSDAGNMMALIMKNNTIKIFETIRFSELTTFELPYPIKDCLFYKLDKELLVLCDTNHQNVFSLKINPIQPFSIIDKNVSLNNINNIIAIVSFNKNIIFCKQNELIFYDKEYKSFYFQDDIYCVFPINNSVNYCIITSKNTFSANILIWNSTRNEIIKNIPLQLDIKKYKLMYSDKHNSLFYVKNGYIIKYSLNEQNEKTLVISDDIYRNKYI
ncbi:MAG: hypothetical protein LBT05_03135 [Planctomycetaceae bacterium]|nr:hypothetical protein [Planctomycetaceae bacterium]